MSRLVSYRSKVPANIKQRIDETLTTTMYLVQTTGPTSYVVQEQNCDKKHKVLIGALQTCSCGDGDVCIHILFVMLKVLRVPATTPIVWQKSLIDSEIDALLRGDYRTTPPRAPPPKKAGSFLKKRQKNAGNCDEESASPSSSQAEEANAQRHELVEGEVCAICQEDMVADQPLTFCRKGCGNNFHIECMKVFGESRKQSKEHIICPLCRHDWGDLALTELKKAMDVANKAPNVHKGVTCKKCQTKPIRNERFRCVQCKNVDLCDRCFKANAHLNHSFVSKKQVADPWVPALRSTIPKPNSVTSEIMEELQNRELTTNDYDLLLELDQREKFPVQEYLLSTLSGGQKITAVNAKSFGEPGATCALCRQSLRIQADVRSILCGVWLSYLLIFYRFVIVIVLTVPLSVYMDLLQHAFHESCLARSLLSQVYTCPSPGCEHVMFPGLHQLTVAKSKALASASCEAGHALEPVVRPPPGALLDSTFCITSVQQSHARTASAASHETTAKRKANVTKKPTSRHASSRGLLSSRPETTEDLSMLSIGLTPVNHPHASATLPGARHARSRQSTSDSKSRPQHHEPSAGKTNSNSPHLPHLGQTPASSSDDRLKHAENLRCELKQLDKERHRKQNIQRQERVRQNLSNNNESNHEALNALLLPPIGQAPVKADLLPLIRRGRTAAPAHDKKMTPPERNVAMDLNPLSIGLPCVSISAIRQADGLTL